MLEATQLTINQYTNRGFTITDVHADLEFECIKNDINTHMEIVAQDDHVPEVERSIRTMKEATRGSIHGLPYKRFPKIMIIELVYHDVTRCLNQFPTRDGISDTLSPLSIVTGVSSPDFNKLKIEFGQYAQVIQKYLPHSYI